MEIHLPMGTPRTECSVLVLLPDGRLEGPELDLALYSARLRGCLSGEHLN